MRNSIINQLADLCCKNDPLVLLDIGAAGGLHDKWTPLRDYLMSIYVEPDPVAYKELVESSPSQDVFIDIALDKEQGKVNFYLTKEPVCSSIYKPIKTYLSKFDRSDRFDVDETINIPVSTLDYELEIKNIHNIDFLKIDTQGSELSILSGGLCAVNSTFGMEIEVEFTRLYENQPLFHDVDKFMNENGFVLFDISRHFWRRKAAGLKGSFKGQLIWGDVLYLKSIEALSDELKKIDDTQLRENKFVKAVIVCLQYGYPDYAFEIVDTMMIDISHQKREAVKLLLDSYMENSTRMREFMGKQKIAAFFQMITAYLTQNQFNSDDPKLGN